MAWENCHFRVSFDYLFRERGSGPTSVVLRWGGWGWKVPLKEGAGEGAALNPNDYKAQDPPINGGLRRTPRYPTGSSLVDASTGGGEGLVGVSATGGVSVRSLVVGRVFPPGRRKSKYFRAGPPADLLNTPGLDSGPERVGHPAPRGSGRTRDRVGLRASPGFSRSPSSRISPSG